MLSARTAQSFGLQDQSFYFSFNRLIFKLEGGMRDKTIIQAKLPEERSFKLNLLINRNAYEAK